MTKSTSKSTINLIRLSHREPDFDQFKRMLKELKGFLQKDADPSDETWRDDLRAVMDYQDEDGSFRMVDSYKIPMDTRVEICHTSTYICTAILMKAFMADETLFESGEREIMRKALQACSRIRISGNGMEYFGQADIAGFLHAHRNLCPNFSRIMDQHCRKVFVYGTLLEGEGNHSYYLQGSSYKGKAAVSGYEMYDIGAFPGIVPGNGSIPGEVYEVDYETLRNLDYLEGEGSLYFRKSVPVKMSTGESAFAWIYVYNGSVEGLERIPVWRKQDYVWYVSYGSNMLRERFLHYIKGGAFEDGGAPHKACTDQTEPLAVRTFAIPYDMYYGNESGSWEGGGVSFLDITKPGSAKGVAYLITREQFDHVASEENGGCPPERSPGWYNTVVSLGTIDGIEAVTITSDQRRPENEPVEAYRDTLRRGLQEHYPGMTDEEMEDYLR